MTTSIETSRWLFGSREYDVTRFDGNMWALDDVGPAPERGQVLVAFRDDVSGELYLTAFSKHTLPFDLTEQFLQAVRQDFEASTASGTA